MDQGPKRSAAEVSRGQGAPGIPEGSRRPTLLHSLVPGERGQGATRPRATKSLRAAASAGPTVLLASERPSDWERGAPGAPSEPRAGERRAARQRLRSHVVQRRAEGREAGREGRGSRVEGEGEGRGRPPQFAPRRGSDTQRSRSRRAGPAAAAAASAASESSRAAGSAAAAAAGRPRRAGLGSGCQRRRSHRRSRSGSPTAPGWAGLGWGGLRAQGRARGGRRTGGLGFPGERPGTAPRPAPPRSALPSASPRARADEPRARGTWKR